MNVNRLSDLLPSPFGDTAVSTEGRLVVSLTNDELSAALAHVETFSESTLAVPEDARQPQADVGTPDVKADDSLLMAYLQSAALHDTYRVDTLTPVPVHPDAAAPPRYADLVIGEQHAVFAYLKERSQLTEDTGGSLAWTLRDDARRGALKQLVESGRHKIAIVQARADAMPQTDAPAISQSAPALNPVDETLWQLLEGSASDLQTQDRRQLVITRRCADWLRDVRPSPALSIPSVERVDEQLVLETLLQPFRHLTGEWRDGKFVSEFVGRQAELSRLYDYLSIRPPASFAAQLTRTLRALEDAAWSVVNQSAGHRPLLIHGPGGSGKSALLSKFALDHLTETSPADRIPFAYLDFDLSALNAAEPVTLLAEAARQLGLQYAANRPDWDAQRQSWLERLGSTSAASFDPTERQEALRQFVALLRASRARHSDEAVGDRLEHGLPFLIVLDTFEELQYHDRDAVKDVFRFLNGLRDHVPTLRVILMGRAPLDDVQQEFEAVESVAVESDVFGTGARTDFDVVQVPLGDLSKTDARGYLMRHGVSDAKLADELIEAVGGNPLSLRLIARLLRENAIDMSSLREEIQWRPGMGDLLRWRKIPPKEVLQGVLFRRILGHIHKEDIRKLAHPGLVLRRITPDLIKDVLAKPCGLGEIDDTTARNYFDDLAQEVAIVGTDRDATGEYELRHRPELRRIMLRLMAADADKQGQIREVHERAIEYYERPPSTVVRRTEALYHRLMLGDLPDREQLADDVPTEEALAAGYASLGREQLDPRPIWSGLAVAATDLPPASVAFLSARLLSDLSPDLDWTQADPRDWELLVLGRASRRARERGNLQSAHAGLQRDQELIKRQRQLWPLSALPLLECTLLERLGRSAEVEKLVETALSTIAFSPISQRRIAEYRLVQARAAARLGQGERCYRGLSLAGKASESLRASFPQVEHALAARVARQLLRFALDCFLLQRDEPIASLAFEAFTNVERDPEAPFEASVLVRTATQLLPHTGGSPVRGPVMQAVLDEARQAGDLLPGEDLVAATSLKAE